MHGIALIRADIKAGVGGQCTLSYIKWLVIPQYSSRKPAALHLSQLVNQNVASGHNFAFEPQPAAEQKRLTESAAIGKFGEVQLDTFNRRQ